MMKSIKTIILIIPVLLLLACQEEFELTETPPTTEDGTISESTEGTAGPNYVVFTNTSEGFMKKWDFGNGTTDEGDEVTAYYPFAGEYTVTLTVFTKGGSVTTTQIVNIDETDPEICNVEVLQLLTGGCGVAEGKTWVIDKDRAGHFGLGPVSSFGPDWYQAGANEKEGGGMYDDEYTFYLNQSVAEVETNGNVFINGGQQSNFPGATAAVGDYIAPYTAPKDMNYAVTTDGEGNQFLSLTKGGFMGYATGVSTYQIMSINENEMFLRFTDQVNGEFAWYLRLIRKGYAPVVADFSFTVDGGEVTFTNASQNATTYEWDFDDGSTSTEQSPVHTYGGDGIYKVKLTASAPGESKSVTKEVTIALEAITVLTEELLTGGGSKAWKLKPAANAFGIGPNKGSPEWFPGWGVDISADRPCLFNDQFIFSTGNVYAYDAVGDIFGEGYMGVSDGCQDEANLTGDAAPWASGTHTFAFTAATDTDPATIAVTGTGAFIVLPKAYNGGEYASAPPDTDATVTYEVLSYNKVGSDEELALTISVGGGYWSYVLIPAE
ncbi:MAG: PKD domain-containing protein [Cyclobacteriaceae bacterium]